MRTNEILEIRFQIHQFIRLFGVLNPTKTPCGYELSLSQVHALQVLESESPLALHELSEKLYLERSTVSRIVNVLVKSGFINRQTNERNRREVLLSLTDHGKNSVNQVRNQSIIFFQHVLKDLSEDERHVILEGFRKFTFALQEVRRHTIEQSVQ